MGRLSEGVSLQVYDCGGRVPHVPEQGKQHACRLQPARGQEDEGVHVVAGDVRGPVEGVWGVGEHGHGSQASPAWLCVVLLAAAAAASSGCMRRKPWPIRADRRIWASGGATASLLGSVQRAASDCAGGEGLHGVEQCPPVRSRTPLSAYSSATVRRASLGHSDGAVQLNNRQSMRPWPRQCQAEAPAHASAGSVHSVTCSQSNAPLESAASRICVSDLGCHCEQVVLPQPTHRRERTHLPPKALASS